MYIYFYLFVSVARNYMKDIPKWIFENAIIISEASDATF